MSLSKPAEGVQGGQAPQGQQPNYLKAHFAPPQNSGLQATPPQLYAPGSENTPAASQPMQGTSSNPTGSTAMDPAQMQQMIQQLTQSQVPNGTMGFQQQQAGQVAYPGANAAPTNSSGMPFGS